MDAPTRAEVARWYANFINLSTPFGLAIAALGGAGVRGGPKGLLLAEGYRLPFPVAGAFTVGNVIIMPGTVEALTKFNPNVLGHEARHSWQYVLCLGLPFLPLYSAATVWSWLRTGDRASFNFFEQTAGLAAGGYRKVGVRPLWRGRRVNDR